MLPSQLTGSFPEGIFSHPSMPCAGRPWLSIGWQSEYNATWEHVSWIDGVLWLQKSHINYVRCHASYLATLSLAMITYSSIKTWYLHYYAIECIQNPIQMNSTRVINEIKSSKIMIWLTYRRSVFDGLIAVETGGAGESNAFIWILVYVNSNARVD